MRLLIDTQLLLWAAAGEGLSAAAVNLLGDPATELLFSVASIWEVASKSGLERPDFDVDAGAFRRMLLDSQYQELAVTGVHAAGVAGLPRLHRDPFDRMLIAQAIAEGATLLSVDRLVLAYP